jgi:hypothetical protein
MSSELLNTIFSGATFAVIAATAIAALVQLRHLRASNQITTLLSLMEQRRTPESRALTRYCFEGELDRKLEDPEYRKRLMVVPVDPDAHPEVQLLSTWEQTGAMLKLRWFSEEAFMETAGLQCIAAWKKLHPVVAIMRRTRGEQVFDNFEYLASRAMRWEAKHPRGTYPRDAPHLQAVDPHPEDAASL